jgi:ABC-type multidrug transport system fused ATPase/permease subunit
LGRLYSAAYSALLSISGSYGKFGSTPEEIEAAAKSAQMHDRIISFPDGQSAFINVAFPLNALGMLTRIRL